MPRNQSREKVLTRLANELFIRTYRRLRKLYEIITRHPPLVRSLLNRVRLASESEIEFQSSKKGKIVDGLGLGDEIYRLGVYWTKKLFFFHLPTANPQGKTRLNCHLTGTSFDEQLSPTLENTGTVFA